MPERVVDVAGVAVMQWLMNVYPGLAVLSGKPATSFPFGLTADGLPVGLQAIGRYLEDRTPIRFAGLVAREVRGFRAPPRVRLSRVANPPRRAGGRPTRRGAAPPLPTRQGAGAIP